jgi:ADP-heptose:LPS heptosyltransferase
VDAFRGRIRFVQVGSPEHDHPRLRGVVELVGKTSHRDLIALCHRCQGGLGPITYIQHLCAAFEKPYVALLGGREPISWTQYPKQTTLHTIGKLTCCLNSACWRSRAVALHDGSDQDARLCEQPVLDLARPVGRCMSLIRPTDVIRAIESHYDGGALSY